MSKLAACPFDGSKNLLPFSDESNRPAPTQYGIKCLKCGAQGPLSRSLAGAQREWNQRRKYTK